MSESQHLQDEHLIRRWPIKPCPLFPVRPFGLLTSTRYTLRFSTPQAGKAANEVIQIPSEIVVVSGGIFQLRPLAQLPAKPPWRIMTCRIVDQVDDHETAEQ